MKHRPLLRLALALAVLASSAQALTQQPPLVPPEALLQRLAGNWPSYSGDYTGQRYSSLAQVDRGNVTRLSLAWAARMNPLVRTPARAPSPYGPAADGVITLVGGEGEGDIPAGTPSMKGTVLAVDGVLYVTSPDHVWALDARDGRELWHYFWKTRGGTHIANRGAAIWKDSLLFETPDNYLVSLDARSGAEKWHVEIASLEQQYFSTPAPVVIGDLVLVGTGNDLDSAGFLQAYDAATGKRVWKTFLVPQSPGDKGLETWPNLEAARHGGGNVWMPGSYDPETDLYITGTGNPTPAYTGVARQGDNLFTCSLVAIRAKTGELVWYFQTSPHDTHDWDSAQTPVLFDGEVDGKPRKLVSTASRNGFFFTLDRVTGERLVTSKFGLHANWTRGLRKDGAPDADPAKSATVPGSWVSPHEGGVINWQPPAFNPKYGLFYVHETNGFNLLYLTDPDPRGSMGLGGKRFFVTGAVDNALQAIDYRTGKAKWRHPWPTGSAVGTGLLTTTTGLLFSGDTVGNFVAMDAENGGLLWHTRIGNITNAPQTYEAAGRQYVLVGVGDMLYAFALY